jgi:NTP pyrophosphatase (non-canonical NTP hydrolase)
MGDIEDLQALLRDFAARRDWERFHDPKNLAMAVAGEVGELVAEFQWLTPAESFQAMADASIAARIRDEIADVAIYLLRLADVLSVDIAQAVSAKVARNEDRFPANR